MNYTYSFDPVLSGTIVFAIKCILGLIAFLVIIFALWYAKHIKDSKEIASRRAYVHWTRKRDKFDNWIKANRHQSLDTKEAQSYIQSELGALELMSFNKPLNSIEEKRREWLVQIMDKDLVVELPN